MQLDLDTLLQVSSELGWLEDPFTTEEIDSVISNLPSDKSPGPDGFNTDFIKKCWPILKQDFYNLCQAFFIGELYLQSINGSYITLIPKGDGGSKVNDFRPISLLNTSMKILTKHLAIRMAAGRVRGGYPRISGLRVSGSGFSFHPRICGFGYPK